MKSQFEIDLYERAGSIARRRRVSLPVPRWVVWFGAIVLAEIGGTFALLLFILGSAIARKQGWL